VGILRRLQLVMDSLGQLTARSCGCEAGDRVGLEDGRSIFLWNGYRRARLHDIQIAYPLFSCVGVARGLHASRLARFGCHDLPRLSVI
jgi:hypothetical protein